MSPDAPPLVTIPLLRMRDMRVMPEVERSQKFEPWPERKEAQLIHLHQRGFLVPDIAEIMWRTPRAISARLVILRKQGRLS